MAGGRNQRHLREVRGVDSAGLSNIDGELAPPATVAVAFYGTLENLTFGNGESVSIDFSGNYRGTDTPITFAVQAGTLPTGLSLSAAGVLSGSSTATGTQSGLVIRATDNSTDTADSNAFDIEILA